MAKRRKPSKSIDLTEAPAISDKSIIYLLGIAIIVANIANSYFMVQMNKNVLTLGEAMKGMDLSAPQDNPSGGDDTVPTEDQEDPLDLLKPETKALIENYQISGTPTLVINCDKMRVGTYAIAEENGQLPEGSALQALINDLCTIAGNGSVFCND